MATQIDKFLGIKYLDDTSSDEKQNPKININMKPHQLSLIGACKEFEKNQFRSVLCHSDTHDYKIKNTVGIIGDNVGSGKTFVALSIIASGMIETSDEHDEKHNYYGKIKTIVKKKITNSNPTLNVDIVVVPHNIIHQWVESLEKTNLKYFVYQKSKDILSFVERFVSDEAKESEDYNIKLWKNKHWMCNFFDQEKMCDTINGYDVILVSSTKFDEFYSSFINNARPYHVNRVFFDEADTINIPRCPFIEAKFTWFITSTFENLIFPRGKHLYFNSSGDLTEDWSSNYNYMNSNDNYGRGAVSQIKGIQKTGFIKETCFSISHIPRDIRCTLILKNDPEFVKSSFSLCEPNRYYIECDYDKNLLIVKDYVSDEVLCRLSAGDVAGAIEKIDCEKVSTNENLIELVTSDLAKNLHNAEVELKMKHQIKFSSKKAQSESIARSEEKVIELRSKIDNIKSKVLQEDLCPVCYDEVNTVALVPCCNTKYCLECITMCSKTGNTSCPFCRSKFNMSDLIILMDDQLAESCGGGSKPKILKDKVWNVKNIIERSKTNPEFKLLIFADYDASFDNLISVLNDSGLKYFTIKGTSSTISKNIANFKSTNPVNPDKIDVLLLNSNHCGSGINLENTTDLVIYHDMTDSKITQIIGRAQRPGRTCPLNIWRLLNDYEIPSDSTSNRGNIGSKISLD